MFETDPNSKISSLLGETEELANDGDAEFKNKIEIVLKDGSEKSVEFQLIIGADLATA